MRKPKRTRPCLDLAYKQMIDWMIDVMTDGFHPLIVKTLTWPNQAATQAFAQSLATRPALSHAMVSLHGGLGAGKTTFVRHLLSALGVTGRIKSPTYAVVEPYTLGTLNIWHFDFYRFNDPNEWEEAGFRDIFASPGLKLVEWPEKAGVYLPQTDVLISIEVLADAVDMTHATDQANAARGLTLSAFTPTGKALLA